MMERTELQHLLPTPPSKMSERSGLPFFLHLERSEHELLPSPAILGVVSAGISPLLLSSWAERALVSPLFRHSKRSEHWGLPFSSS